MMMIMMFRLSNKILNNDKRRKNKMKKQLAPAQIEQPDPGAVACDGCEQV